MTHDWRKKPLADRWGWSAVCRNCGMKARSTKGPRGGHSIAYTKAGVTFPERPVPPCPGDG